MHCKQCYSCSEQNSKAYVLSYEEIATLLYDLKKNNVIRLSITGGEPFIREDIIDILELASNLGFEIYISTNGTFNSIDFKRLSKTKIKVLQISLDGVGEYHDRIRGLEGAYQKAIRYIQSFKKVRHDTQIGVAFTLMQENKNQMIELYEELKCIPIDILSIVPVQRIGRAGYDDILPPDELKKILDQIAEHWKKTGKEIKLNTMVSPALVPEVLQEEGTFPHGYLCTFPYSIAVAADGRCALCDGLLDDPRFLIGNIHEGIEKLCCNEMIDTVKNISVSEMHGVCQKCTFKQICAGGCRADSCLENNSFCASDIMCQAYYDAGIFPEKFLEK